MIEVWLATIDRGHRVIGSSVGSKGELEEFLGLASVSHQLVDDDSLPITDVNYALNRLKSGDFRGRLCIDFNL